jgi:LCP family protein required for cell wall assembly
MSVTITLASIVIASLVAVAAYAVIINNKLGTDLEGNKMDFTAGAFEGSFVAPKAPEDPFWMLLMGTDNREGFEVPRTDTLILVYVDQANKAVNMVSIPRDTYVPIDGYGSDKINAAYVFGELEQSGGGVPKTIKTVSDFTGVDIAYFAQVDFDGLVNLVDSLGGVEVDVPVDIIGDYAAADHGNYAIDIYAGIQTLDGAQALTFCRSRDFPNGDYQRQADQRTFLQALAKKVLASDPATIAVTVTNLANMTYTNMDLAALVNVAQSMRGMQESGIYTYTVPSTTDEIPDNDGNLISYVIADSYGLQELLAAIEAGEHPERQDASIAGIIPDDYVGSSAATDQLAGKATNVKPENYTIEVRNGNGIAGCATSVSDMLYLAGYNRGELGNTDAYVYNQTLIIYDSDEHKAVAEDIRKRLGYGKTVDSVGRYIFTGDVLVVVGDDFIR